MFGGLGGALKSLTGKAEEMMEKTKKSVEEMAAEKKAAAQAMLEGQVKKTGDSLSQVKGDVEKTAVEGRQAAIDGFDAEVSNIEKSVDSSATETQAAAPQIPQLPIDPSQILKAASVVGAVEGIDKGVEQAVDGAIQQAGQVVDSKIKETDQFLDEKREEVVQKVQTEATKATEGASQGVGAILGKAKGFLNF